MTDYPWARIISVLVVAGCAAYAVLLTGMSPTVKAVMVLAAGANFWGNRQP